MINDKELVLCTEQVVTASAASENYINAGKAGDSHSDMFLLVTCEETADSATDAATLTVALQTDSASTFASPATLIASEAFAIADAHIANGATVMKVKVPAGLEQYVRVYFTAGTENLSKGKFSARLVSEVQTNA